MHCFKKKFYSIDFPEKVDKLEIRSNKFISVTVRKTNVKPNIKASQGSMPIKRYRKPYKAGQAKADKPTQGHTRPQRAPKGPKGYKRAHNTIRHGICRQFAGKNRLPAMPTIAGKFVIFAGKNRMMLF